MLPPRGFEPGTSRMPGKRCTTRLQLPLDTHAFDLVGIKRSWHSTEGASVIVGVERVSVTYRQPACTVYEDEYMWAEEKRI